MANCYLCRREVIGFRDEISLREWEISQMCQRCQDSVFDDRPDDDCDPVFYSRHFSEALEFSGQTGLKQVLIFNDGWRFADEPAEDYDRLPEHEIVVLETMSEDEVDAFVHRIMS